MGNRKQMMDIRACKGFTVQESNEHRRNWDGHRWERALHEGNYDLTRQHLNFEIVKGGKIQPIDKSKTIPQMMKERLATRVSKTRMKERSLLTAERLWRWY